MSIYSRSLIDHRQATHRLRHPASVLCPGLMPRPREISRHGSTVSLKPWQRGQRMSLWSRPPKVLCTMQLHLRRVDPRALACAAFKSAIKHSWASCCAYPAKDPEARHVVASRAVGPNAGCGGGGICVAAKSRSSSQQAQSSLFLHHRGLCLSPRK